MGHQSLDAMMSKRARRRARGKPSAPSEPDWRIQPGGPLFHYTTAAGLLGIVKDQVLWATHANYLNDTTELKILAGLLAPQISKELRSVVPKLEAAGAFTSELMKTFGEGLFDDQAQRICRAIMRSVENTAPIYITSFCMHAEDSEESRHGLLSQWRGYARGGFAIEFDEKALDSLTLSDSKQSLQMFATRKVAYRDHEKHANLDRFNGAGTAMLRAAFQIVAPKLATRDDIAQLLGDIDLTAFVIPTIDTMPFLKSPRFEEEREYRLVASAFRPQYKNHKEVRSTIPVHFREGLGGLVPYIRLFDKPEQRLPIKKIIVGPHRDQQNQYDAVRLLLEEHEIEAEVICSDTSLRF